MKIVGLDGYNHTLKLDSAVRTTVSKPHARMRALLKSLFPLERVYEEVTLLGTRTNKRPTTLFADFLIPGLSMIVEVDGAQHKNYNKFFHGNKDGFRRALARDKDKAEWCELNHITLIRVDEHESEEQWASLIIKG